MENKIKIAVCGYGNLGKGVIKALDYHRDFTLKYIFTRRNVENIQLENDYCQVVNIKEVFDNLEKYQKEIDVLILCLGSAKDLPIYGPLFAEYFNTVDSFDTHANILEYYCQMNEICKKANTLSCVSIGWDPGLFSLNRLYAKSILPQGNTYTFWGKGVSQGHSEAIKKIAGVKKAIQYTIPIQKSIEDVIAGKNPVLENKDKHRRECFVVLEENGDSVKIEEQIKTMPHYFDEYETIVHYITEEEFEKNHCQMPHGGFVIHSAKTDESHLETIQYQLKLDSNPEFTSSVLLAYARAIYQLRKEEKTGAMTVFDIAPIYLTSMSKENTIRQLL